MILSGDKSGARQVLLPSGQLGTGLRIIGGRGNGFFIQSDRQTNRSLQSGDEVLAIGDKELDKMNYAEVKELLATFKEKGKCIIQVKSNLQGQCAFTESLSELKYSTIKAGSQYNATQCMYCVTFVLMLVAMATRR